jgi:hypothetical protein
VKRSNLLSLTWSGQSIYYMATGLWPFVDIDSFQKVTGPKVDLWLVKTVGALVTVIGAVLAVGWRRGAGGTANPEVPMLATGSAAALAGIGSYYSLRGRISKVYLLDAIVEVGIILIWFLTWPAKGRGE